MKKIILADQKLNQLVDDITQKLMDDYAFEQGAIGGGDIAQFCAHSQVNQFILFRIYQDWNAHIGQMVHPYFDFTAYEVKEGLRRFLNILSGHILVKEKDFEPLVRQAVYNSLRLLLNPEEAIGKFFFLNTDSIKIEIYRKHAPYYTNFDFVIQAILKYHEKNDLEFVEKSVFFEKFERVIEIWEKKEARSINDYQRELFKSLTGKELEEVIGGNARPADSIAAPLEEKKQVEEAAKSSDSRKKPVIKIRPTSGSEPETKPVIEEAAPEVREEKPSMPPWVEQPATETFKEEPPITEPKFSQSSKPPRTNLPPWVEQQEEKAPEVENTVQNMLANQKEKEQGIVDRFQNDRPKSINEMFANREQKTIVEQSQEAKEQADKPRIQVNIPQAKEPEIKKVEEPGEMPVVRTPLVSREEEEEERGRPEVRTIADQFRNSSQNQNEDAEDDGNSKAIKPENIPVHKQFQFVQKVFGGSSVKFKVVLDKINKTDDLEGAIEVLDKYVFNDPNVNRNDKVSKEFEAMVRNRFES